MQIAFAFVVYPSLVLAYMGQAAYLSAHHVIEKDYQIGFYVSVPGTRKVLCQTSFNLRIEFFEPFLGLYNCLLSTFYGAEMLRWPVLGIAILASVVGSQAMITGTFSIIKQCSALGFFPRVKIVHTSSEICGRVYIPEINWTLMLLCLAVTIGFRNTRHISNASGNIRNISIMYSHYHVLGSILVA